MPVARLRAKASALLAMLVSPFFVSAAGRMVSQVLAAATVLVAARYVTLSEFGVLAIAQAVTIILNSLLYTGLHHQVLRSTDLPRENATLFTCQAALGAGGSLFMAVLAVSQSADSLLREVFLGFAPIPLMVGVAAHFEALLIRAERIRAAVLSTAAAEALGFAALCVAFALGAGVYALVVARLTATVIAFLLKALLAAEWPGVAVERAVAATSFAASRPLYVTTGTNMMSNYGADLLLGAFLAPAAVGAYRAASRVAVTGMDIIAKPVEVITWSNLARLERGALADQMGAAWVNQAKFLTLVAWPALACLALLSKPVVDILLDESWGAAAPVISVLALALAVGVLDVLIGPALTCAKQPKRYVRLTLTRAGVIVVALAAAAPFGAIAAAFGLLAARAVMAPIAVHVALGALGVPAAAMVRALAPSALVTLACCLTVVLVRGLSADDAAGFALTVSLGALCWLGLAGVLIGKRIVELPKP